MTNISQFILFFFLCIVSCNSFKLSTSILKPSIQYNIKGSTNFYASSITSNRILSSVSTSTFSSNLASTFLKTFNREVSQIIKLSKNSQFDPQFDNKKKMLLDLIYNFIDLNPENLDLSDYNKIMYELSRINSFNTTPEIKRTLQYIINKYLFILANTPQNSKNYNEFLHYSILYFRKFGFTKDDFSEKDKRLIFNLIEDNLSHFSTISYATIFHSLSKMKFTLSDFNSLDKILPLLNDSLLNLIDVIEPRYLSNVIYSLSVMKMNRLYFSNEVFTKIEKRAIETLGLMNEQELANFIYGLGNIYNDTDNDNDESDIPLEFKKKIFNNKNKNQISQTLIENLFLELSKKLKTMKSQEISNTLLGLSKLNVKFSSLTPVFINEMNKIFIENILLFTSQGIGSALSSLGKMEWKWSSFSTSNKHTFLKNLNHIISNLNSNNLAMVLHGLGKIDVEFNSEFSDLKENLFTNIIKSLNYSLTKLSTQEISMATYGLGKLGFNHLISNEKNEIFLKNFNKKYVEILSSHISNMKEIEFAMSIYGLGLQEYKLSSNYNKLIMNNPALIELIIKNIFKFLSNPNTKLQPQEISNILYGLGKMEFHSTWFNYENQVILINNLAKVYMPRMNQQEIVNSLHALGKMEFIWDNSFSIDQRNIIFSILLEKLKSFSLINLCILIYSLGILELSWKNMPLELQQEISNALDKNKDSPLISPHDTSILSHGLTNLGFDFPFELQDYNNSKLTLLSSYAHCIYLFNRILPPQEEKKILSEYATQFSIFFEVLKISKDTNELVKKFNNKLFRNENIITENNNNENNKYTLVKKRDSKGFPIFDFTEEEENISSKFHLDIEDQLLKNLYDLSLKNNADTSNEPYKFINEFNLIPYQFPIDIAIYKGKNLVALIEINGDSHYKKIFNFEVINNKKDNESSSELSHFKDQLRRKDLIKERIAKFYFPSVPYFRISSQLTQQLGLEYVCKEFAKWIFLNDKKKSNSNGN